MHRYRKKPVIIEVFQMTKERRCSNSEWPNWLHEAWRKHPEDVGAFYFDVGGNGRETTSIHTLEGDHLVEYDDWIIQGIQGELYPCRPDIFDATYEPEQEIINAKPETPAN